MFEYFVVSYRHKLLNYSYLIHRFKSNKSWLNRHTNDIFVKKATESDLRARSAFKLRDIQKNYSLIRKNDFVIDMGAAPGGWSVVCSEYLDHNGLLVAVDLLPMQPIPNCHIITGNMLSKEVIQQVYDLSNGRQADVILSDMMINMCGHKDTDHFRSMELCHFVLSFCHTHLKIGGHVVCKYFRGQDEKDLLAECRTSFQTVKTIKPEASRLESREMYLLAMNKK